MALSNARFRFALRATGGLVCTAFLAREVVDMYRRIYVMSKYLATREGATFARARVRSPTDKPIDEEEVQLRQRQWYAGWAGAGVSAAASYAAFKYALDRILISAKTTRHKSSLGVAATSESVRLFDDLSNGNVRPRITWHAVWTLLGPAANREGPRLFVTQYGARMLSATLSVAWALVLAPYFHARAEAAVAPMKDPAALQPLPDALNRARPTLK